MLSRAPAAEEDTRGQGSASRSSSGSREVRSSRLLPLQKAAPAQRAAVPTQSIRERSSRALAPSTCATRQHGTCRSRYWRSKSVCVLWTTVCCRVQHSGRWCQPQHTQHVRETVCHIAVFSMGRATKEAIHCVVTDTQQLAGTCTPSTPAQVSCLPLPPAQQQHRDQLSVRSAAPTALASQQLSQPAAALPHTQHPQHSNPAAGEAPRQCPNLCLHLFPPRPRPLLLLLYLLLLQLLLREMLWNCFQLRQLQQSSGSETQTGHWQQQAAAARRQMHQTGPLSAQPPQQQCCTATPLQQVLGGLGRPGCWWWWCCCCQVLACEVRRPPAADPAAAAQALAGCCHGWPLHHNKTAHRQMCV